MLRGRKDAARSSGPRQLQHNATGTGSFSEARRGRNGEAEPPVAENHTLHVSKGKPVFQTSHEEWHKLYTLPAVALEENTGGLVPDQAT